jgi:prophage regulatory protein
VSGFGKTQNMKVLQCGDMGSLTNKEQIMNTATEHHSPSSIFIRMKRLVPRIDTGPTSIHRWVESGIFPAPIKIGPKAIAWRLSEIEKWETDPAAWREANSGEGATI